MGLWCEQRYCHARLPARGSPHLKGDSMKKVLLLIGLSLACSVALAQVGTTVKEGAKATGEKAQQYGDEAKAAVSSQPSKSVSKAKAHAHKASAHQHAKSAKDAAKEIPK